MIVILWRRGQNDNHSFPARYRVYMTENNEFDVADLRREYIRGGLRRSDLTENPLELFERWLKQACEARLPDPTAMCVATVDTNGQPYQRIVLLKHYDDQGLVFYTNLGSRKAQQLAENPHISLLFPWHMLDRQVIFLGKAERLSTLEVLKYFHSRPKDSQIGAWVSQQSSRISARGVLESKFLELKQNSSRVTYRCPVFGAGFASNSIPLSFGRGNIAFMTVLSINGKPTRGKLTV